MLNYSVPVTVSRFQNERQILILAIEKTSECVSKLERRTVTTSDAETLKAYYEAILKFNEFTPGLGNLREKLSGIKIGVGDTLRKVQKYCGIYELLPTYKAPSPEQQSLF